MKQSDFLTYSWRSVRSNTYTYLKLELKLEKIIGNKIPVQQRSLEVLGLKEQVLVLSPHFNNSLKKLMIILRKILVRFMFTFWITLFSTSYILKWFWNPAEVSVFSNCYNHFKLSKLISCITLKNKVLCIPTKLSQGEGTPSVDY